MNFKSERHIRFLIIGGLFLLCGTSLAQKLQQAPANDPAVHWLAPAAAQLQVQNKLEILQPQLQGLTPGTTPYTDLLRRIFFYKAILRGLLSEMTVAQAIDAALPDAASVGGLYEQAFTPESTLRLLYDEAVTLLTDL